MAEVIREVERFGYLLIKGFESSGFSSVDAGDTPAEE
jgi:hypothetical protein